MFAPITQVLFVNVELGAGCPTSDGPSTLVSKTPKELVRVFLREIEQECRVSTKYIAPANREELDFLFAREWQEGTAVISTDNAVSHAILKVLWQRNRAVNCDMIFDQHADIYSVVTHGKELTKANPYRKALDAEYTAKVLFVGIRQLEEAFFNPFILLPKIFRQPHIFAYAFLRYMQGQHAGLDQKIILLPQGLVRDFEEGVCEALKIFDSYAALMRTWHGLSFSFGFEIDLDVFDSQKVSGVDYGIHMQRRLRETAEKKFNNKNSVINLRALMNYCYNRWVASYVGEKVRGNGLPFPDQEMILQSIRHIYLSPLDCRFFHITELKLEYDDENGTTADLVKDLVRSAVFISRQPRVVLNEA